ncbi:MAG TPA: hypothetical protein VFY44_03780 [Thermoleophilaceae bacterium]|nr:hypothetical protein [Thermoleophilaceae bacterium]
MTLSPRFTAISWLVAGVITLAGMLATPWESSTETADYLATIGSNATQGQIAALLLHFGYMALVPAFFGVYWLCREHGGRLRAAGGALAVFGAIGLPGLLAVDFYGIALYETLSLKEAVKVEEAVADMPGSAILAMSAVLPMMVGGVLLFVAAYRARVLPLWMPIVLALTMFGPMALEPVFAIAMGAGVLAIGVGMAVNWLRPGVAEPVLTTA